MEIEQCARLRNQALEQFAQVVSDLQELKRRKKILKNQATVLLEEVRRLTHGINQAQSQSRPNSTPLKPI